MSYYDHIPRHDSLLDERLQQLLVETGFDLEEIPAQLSHAEHFLEELVATGKDKAKVARQYRENIALYQEIMKLSKLRELLEEAGFSITELPEQLKRSYAFFEDLKSCGKERSRPALQHKENIALYEKILMLNEKSLFPGPTPSAIIRPPIVATLVPVPPAIKQPYIPNRTFFQCYMGAPGYPRKPFPEVNRDGDNTVLFLKQMLMKHHGFLNNDATIGVVITNSFAVLLRDDVLIKNMWPASEDQPCVFYSFYNLTGTAGSVYTIQSTPVGSKLVSASTEHGEQLLFACLIVFRRRNDSVARNVFLNHLLSVCDCLPFVSLLSAYLDNPASTETKSFMTFISRGFLSLFQEILTPHFYFFKLDPTNDSDNRRVLEYSRECLASLIPSFPSALGFKNQRFSFDKDKVYHPTMVIDDMKREFVVVFPASGTDCTAVSADMSSQPDIYDLSVLRTLAVENPKMGILGRKISDVVVNVSSVPPDEICHILFFSRIWSEEVIVVALSDPSVKLRRLSPATIISDVTLLVRQADSSDFEKGYLRVVNPRSLRSQRNEVITFRGTGAVAIFINLSKNQDAVNIMDPLKPDVNDVSCKYEDESKLLALWIQDNPKSYPARKLVSGTNSMDMPTVEDSRPVKEAINVLFDSSGSMRNNSMFPTLTRTALCQQSLQSFLDRLAAYDLPFRVQLTTFDVNTSVKCNFTSLYANFQQHITDMHNDGGSTNLFDALIAGCNDLVKAFPDSSNVRRRIFILSDGCDSGSKETAYSAAQSAIRFRITIDSICIGDEGNFDMLKGISLATGGLCFKVDNLEELFHLFESEPMLSLACRLDQVPITVSDEKSLIKVSLLPFSTMPKMPLPKLLTSSILSGANALVKAQKLTGSTQTKGVSPSLRHILRALSAYERGPHPFIRVYPSDDNINFWIFILQG